MGRTAHLGKYVHGTILCCTETLNLFDILFVSFEEIIKMQNSIGSLCTYCGQSIDLYLIFRNLYFTMLKPLLNMNN